MIVMAPEFKMELKHKRKMRNIRRYGDQSMSYSSRQEGMKEFRDPRFSGFIPYMSLGEIDYVLSDPITPFEDYCLATELFVAQSKQPVFCQISHRYASILSNMGYIVNGFGVEHFLNLKKFEVSWKVRRGLKRWLSKLTNKNYLVFEDVGSESSAFDISREWLKEKSKGREFRFMARPFNGIYEEDVRVFYLMNDSKVLGFCSFDPVYDDSLDNNIDHYVLQHLRLSNEAPQGSGDTLLTSAILQLKEEGLKKISLGLAPLSERDSGRFRDSKMAESVFCFLSNTKKFYHFKEVGEHKNRYHGEKIQRYIATPKMFTPKSLWGLLKINNLI